MKKKVLISSLGVLAIGAGSLILFNSKDGKTEATSNDTVQSESVEFITVGQEPSEEDDNTPKEASEPVGVGGLTTESPIEGWNENKFLEVQSQFEDMNSLEDYEREIVQMTTPKIESTEIRRLQGGDAPIFPFTPGYPSPVGHFDPFNEFILFNDDNIEYFKYFAEELALDDQLVNYYQEFLTDWQNEDLSNLVQIHKDLLENISKPSEVTEAYLAADDLVLATKEQEEAFINHFNVGEEVEMMEEETTFDSLD